MSQTVAFDGTLTRSGVSESFSISKTFDERMAFEIEVADGASDKQLAFSDIGTVSFGWVKSNKAITVAYANGGTAIPLSANEFHFICGNLAAIYVSNASGETALVQCEVYGT